MTKRYDVIHEGRSIGRAWYTPDAQTPTTYNYTLAPLDWSGDSADDDLTIRITEHINRSYDHSIPVRDAIVEMLGEVVIEAHKVELRETKG
jgi:hypothetical protein